MMNSASNNTFGTLSSAPDGRIVSHIYTYIDSVLCDFQGTNEENENSITNRLCKALEFKKPAECSYFFHHQNIENEKENTSTDFAVFGTFAYSLENNINDTNEPQPIVKFEAKRLSSSLPKSREREYVVGEYKIGKQTKNSGGIERFKNGRHGKDVSNACMIAYVQSDSFSHWFEKINGFIRDEINSPQDSNLSWGDHDALQVISVNAKLASYLSNSQRSVGDFVRLKHFWINMV